MTAPIPVYKNSTIAGGRKTEGGVFHLLPTDEVRNIVVYLFLHYAQKYDIRLLVLCILSNHVHWVADDPHANYPAFLTAVHSKITEVLNHYYGRTGPMWANCKPQRTRLLDLRCIEDKMLYAATNATWHGIDRESRTWNGFVFSPEDIGKIVTSTCPDYLLDNYGSYPASLEYQVPKPACYSHLTDAKARSRFRQKRRARERAIAIERRDKPFLTSELALQASPDQVPRPAKDPRDLSNKLFDSSSPELCEAARSDLDTFRRKHGSTRRAYRDGDRDIVWPHGTYAMRVLHGCPTRERLT